MPGPASAAPGSRLVSLDDPRARDPGVAGAKAATLARARAAGLPCLPGWVVPVAVGREPLRRGGEALESGGSGQARLLVAAATPDAAVLDELAGLLGAIDGPVVVRSSSLAEGDPAWAGAFSSFAGVGAADIATAVCGVWASAFTLDALRRAAALGAAVGGGGLAVLVQPELSDGPGGSARLLPDGTVQVAVTRGVPAAVPGTAAAICRGLQATVDATGAARGPAAGALGTGPMAAVARLARRVGAALGHDLIEWGWADGSAVLLQARTAAAGITSEAPKVPPSPALATHGARRLAALATRFPGPLGQALVLPWALGCPSAPVPVAPVPPVADPSAALARAAQVADALTAQAWRMPPRKARRLADRVLSGIRGLRPEQGLARLDDLVPVDEDCGREVVTLLTGLAAAMVGAGLVPTADEVWRHDEHGLRRILAGETSAPPVRRGPDRWEPFLYQVVATQGTVLNGVGAAPGVGAGPVGVLGDATAAPGRHRGVLVAPEPRPDLAALLWPAAALVTGPGDPSAHLFEVAARLGVPAVVDADVAWLCARGGPAVTAAVDGTSGTVWALDLEGRHGPLVGSAPIARP